jgi:hypothetical protein
MLRFRRPHRRSDPRRQPRPGGNPLTRIRDLIREAIATLVWLVAAAAISLGAAGVVAGMDTPPAEGGDRTGRTIRGDVQVDAALDPIEAEMRDLSAAIGRLAEQARVVLSSLSGNATEPAETATALGTGLVADITARVERIDGALAAVPIIGTPAAAYELSPAARDRHASYVAALETTAGIEEAWTRLTVGSLSASRLSGLLAAHDEAVVAAAERGRDADYATALERLDEADGAIAEAKTLRDRLAATVDVTTLDEWLDRSGDYDVALRALYVAVRRADGQVTDAVRAAIRAEAAAKSRLPPDTRALVLIMSDIGRGGMNAAAIEIERVRTDLDEALAPPLANPAP